jgi:hypothetical protein
LQEVVFRYSEQEEEEFLTPQTPDRNDRRIFCLAGHLRGRLYLNKKSRALRRKRLDG